MSETSEEKTRRRYLALLTGNEWTMQYSVFYANPALSIQLLDDQIAFKQKLRKEYPDQPFLIRIQTKLGNGLGDKTLQAWLSIITTKPVEGFESFLDKTFPVAMNGPGRKLNRMKLYTMTTALSKQKPHDLTKIFGDIRIRRWTLLNEPKLKPVQ